MSSPLNQDVSEDTTQSMGLMGDTIFDDTQTSTPHPPPGFPGLSDPNLRPLPPLHRAPTVPTQGQSSQVHGDSWDIPSLIHYMEQCRLQDEARRREEDRIRRAEDLQDDARRREEDRIRREEDLQDDARRREEDRIRREEDRQQLLTILTTLMNARPPPQGTTTHAPADHTSPPPPDQKLVPIPAPILQHDATYQTFRTWRIAWQDFSSYHNIPSRFSREQQLIQLRACLGVQTQHLLQHTLGIPPSTHMRVEEVLDALETHFRGLCKEVLQRRDLMSCKQAEGESFQQYYIRLCRLAEDMTVCTGGPVSCRESQIKAILTLGLRDEEMIRRVSELPNGSTLQQARALCETYESAVNTSSAIRTPGAQACAVSTYKKEKHQRARQDSPPPQGQHPTQPCTSCTQSHDEDKCPAANATCRNCGRRGHYTRTPTCPATSVQCRSCRRVGHYEKCCRKHQDTTTQLDNNDESEEPGHQMITRSDCRRLEIRSSPY